MSTQIAESNRIPAVFSKDGAVLTNSRDVASFFERNHRDVLRAIDNLLISLAAQNWAAEKSAFLPAPFTDETQPGRTFRSFDMDRDGFTLLAMGFTGEKALKWKLRYIEAFNVMEAQLKIAPAIDPANISRMQLIEIAMQAETERLELEKKVGVLEPKAEVYDRLANEAGKTAEAVREQVRVITQGLTNLAKLVPERQRPAPQLPMIEEDAPFGADPSIALAFRVRSLVKESGEAPSVISRKCGFGKDYVRDVISGKPRKKSFRFAGLLRLAMVLNCDVDYLTLRQDMPRRKETDRRPRLFGVGQGWKQ